MAVGATVILTVDGTNYEKRTYGIESLPIDLKTGKTYYVKNSLSTDLKPIYVTDSEGAETSGATLTYIDSTTGYSLKFSKAGTYKIYTLDAAAEIGLMANVDKVSTVMYSYTLEGGVTIPKSRPDSPTIDVEPKYDDLRHTLTMTASPSKSGDVQTFASMTFNAYKLDNNSAETLVQTYTTSNEATTNFVLNKIYIDPNIYPNIKINVYQTNTVGLSSLTTTVTKNNLCNILGKAILPDGTKKNIVRVRTKKTDGSLTSGDYEHPLSIVEPS